MKDKNYSWKGSPNAGLILLIVTGIAAFLLFASAFSFR